jgi:hypothetical protein
MFKYLLASFLLATLLNSSIIDDAFLYGDFKEIKRFDALLMDEDGLKDESQDLYNDIVSKIKSYIDNSHKVKVTIIGYTDRPTDAHALKILSDKDPIILKIENFFRYSLSSKDSETLSQFYAKTVKEKLTKDGIDEDILVSFHKGGEDIAYSDMTSQGREMSNRVMISAYIYNKEKIDSDLDGVEDVSDKCKDTIKGLKVDLDGCPFDDDNDGVYNYLDRCLNTKIGEKVDDTGCVVKMD